MAKIVGVTVSERMSAGLVVDHKLVGELRRFPEQPDDKYALVEMPTESLVRTLCEQVVLAANGTEGISAVGVALPGLVKQGVVEAGLAHMAFQASHRGKSFRRRFGVVQLFAHGGK